MVCCCCMIIRHLSCTEHILLFLRCNLHDSHAGKCTSNASIPGLAAYSRERSNEVDASGAIRYLRLHQLSVAICSAYFDGSALVYC